MATFGNNNEFAHVIIFPHHKKEIIAELIDDLVKINKLDKPVERKLIK